MSKSQVISFRLSADEHRVCLRLAKEQGISIQKFARDCIQQVLNQQTDEWIRPVRVYKGNYRLLEDILTSSKRLGIDPYTTPFQPKDLELTASDYGSFNNYTGTKKGFPTFLRVVERREDGRPIKYVLIKKEE